MLPRLFSAPSCHQPSGSFRPIPDLSGLDFSAESGCRSGRCSTRHNVIAVPR